MRLFVFDIDGTLLDSSNVDSRLYLESLEAVLGEVSLRSDWSEYQNVTDQGLLREILHDNGHSQDPVLFDRVQEIFLRSLAEYLRTHGPFPEIPGARGFVRSLHEADDYRVAYATGGWGRSAKLKLQTAGFPIRGTSLASSDDHDDRVSIMRRAVSSSPEPRSLITYFGDGPWDRQACDELGWNFVAVGKQLGGIHAFDPEVLDIAQIKEN